MFGRNVKWGIINTKGEFVVQPKYDKADDLMLSTMDLFAVRQKGKWGYVDATGEFVIAPQYNQVGVFFDDALVNDVKDKYMN